MLLHSQLLLEQFKGGKSKFTPPVRPITLNKFNIQVANQFSKKSGLTGQKRVNKKSDKPPLLPEINYIE